MKKCLIPAFWLCLWQAASIAVSNQILLVGPLDTLCALTRQAASRAFWQALCFSFGRIFLGFFLAFSVGIATAALSSAIPLIGTILSPAIQFMKSVPVASFVILALIWTGSENLSVFITFLVVYPMIYMSALSGIENTDQRLLEMARIFHIPPLRQAASIYRISVFPYLESACKTALSMGFKSGIAAEVIGVPDGSVGEGLYMAKIYLSTAELFAWTLTIIMICAIFEKTVLYCLQKFAGKAIW